MKLYFVQQAPASMRWHASKSEGAKTARAYNGELEERRVAENGREELAGLLNSRELYSDVAVASANTERVAPVTLLNGIPLSEPMDDAARSAEALERALKPSYSQFSASLEESWEKLPLAHKLHFAALAMEEAREKL